MDVKTTLPVDLTSSGGGGGGGGGSAKAAPPPLLLDPPATRWWTWAYNALVSRAWPALVLLLGGTVSVLTLVAVLAQWLDDTAESSCQVQ